MGDLHTPGLYLALLEMGTERKIINVLLQIFQDQMRALDIIQGDPELSHLTLIQAPLVDVEIRGVPALRFLGDIIWK